ncbi:MAG: ABC transporter ATP-binding protein [Ruminococcaceae bacterium]|nr:ABC transporter ATP-binding protein [Oscillospiraceae bacterium]
MLEINDLKKIYGDRTVLNIDKLKMNKGETVVIVGPNGSGKSTLLKILSGVITKSEGSFGFDGELYYLPQQSIPFRKSVRKNILFSAKDSTNKEQRCNELLKELQLMHLADKNAKGLSGGECQRLALGRILINKCDLLLLDEPSSAADIEGTEIIENAIKRYREETGCAILMTTHSPRQALNLADRIIMLREGRIVEEGRPEQLLSAPQTEWGRKFIGMWKID